MKTFLVIISLTFTIVSFGQRILIPFEDKIQQWGYLNPDGSIAIKNVYGEVMDFCPEGIAPVFVPSHGPWKFIDADGAEIDYGIKDPVPLFGIQYTGYRDRRRFVDGLMIVHWDGGETGVINTNGQVVHDAIYSSVGLFEDGISLAVIGKTEWYVLFKDGRKVKVKTPAKKIHRMVNGYAPFIYKKYYGYINQNGEIAIEPKFERVGYFDENGIAWAKDDNGMVGYINTSGEWIFPPTFEKVDPFDETSHTTTAMLHDKFYILNDKFEQIAVENVDKMGEMIDGCTWIRVGDSVGAINYKGEIIAQPQYQSVKPFKDGISFVEKDNKWGIIDTTGTLLLPTEYDRINRKFNEGMIAIEKNDRFGFANLKGEVVIEPQFAAVLEFENGYCPAKSAETNEWGMIDMSGNWTIEPKYRHIGTASLVDY